MYSLICKTFSCLVQILFPDAIVYCCFNSFVDCWFILLRLFIISVNKSTICIYFIANTENEHVWCSDFRALYTMITEGIFRSSLWSSRIMCVLGVNIFIDVHSTWNWVGGCSFFTPDKTRSCLNDDTLMSSFLIDYQDIPMIITKHRLDKTVHGTQFCLRHSDWLLVTRL